VSSTLSRVPPHLRHLIVTQDYARYTAIDHAVWRFVLLQTHARLKSTAHPAYADGLGRTGISVERIPRIGEMDEHLARIGWGAVCVDGFIPPRAFHELQSLSILPIAADMRSAEHLVYTPAPDIIHEAAGHAPILPEPVYAEYLRRIGAAGARAFTLPEDGAVDRAVHALSEIKESPTATAAQVERAEQDLRSARSSTGRASEATRLSRLYWWTAEYGLVGKPDDYKLYGAGLLSSLWESFACHAREVAKLPLSASVQDVDYDVTKPQPQLFVAPSFERLHDVLGEVVKQLPSVRGGELALAEAALAREVATIQLSGGVTLFGTVSARIASERQSRVLVVSSACAELDRQRERAREIYVVLGDARSVLSGLGPGSIELVLADGVRLRGRLERIKTGPACGAALLRLSSGTLTAGGALQAELGPEQLVVLAESGLGAHAGAPSDFFPETALPETRVPAARSLPPRESELLMLYEQALAALRSTLGTDVVPVFERLHRQLCRDFEHDWLLRWNLLESLKKIGHAGPLSAALERELIELESHFEGRQPIASGLRYLASLSQPQH
jgi:phenylalanine-4-hydroxylase